MAINDTTSIADKIRPVKFPTEFPTNNKQQKTNANFEKQIMEAAEVMEREKEDAQKLALAAAKMHDPFNPDDKTGQEAMDRYVDLSAKTAAIKAQAQMSLAQLHAQQNPAIELSSLVGKEIEYQDNTRMFNGQTPAKFNFNVDTARVPEGMQASIAVDVNIYDSKDKLVYSTAGHHAIAGDNSYSWQGVDREGNRLDVGKYRLEVSAARATYFDSGQKFDIDLEVKSALRGVVQQVRLNEEQVATSMVLEGGKVIERQQLVGFSENVTPQEQIVLDPSLIGKAAEFDFSRLDIEHGSAMLYFLNTEGANELRVRIYATDTGELKKELTLEDIDVADYSYDLSSKVRDLADGLYDVEVLAVSRVEGEESLKPLARGAKTAAIIGVNLFDKYVTTKEGLQIKASNIGFVGRNTEGNVLESLAKEMKGKSIEFKNNEVRYVQDQLVTGEFKVKKPEDGTMLLTTTMLVSDLDNNSVATRRWDYNPYAMLKEESKAQIKDAMPEIAPAVFSKLEGDEGDSASQQQLVDIIRKIEQMLHDAAIEYSDEYEGSRDIYNIYLEWGGEYDSADGAPEKVAAEGEIYKVKYVSYFVDKDGQSFSEITENNSTGIIRDIKFDGDEISHYILENSQTIRNEQLIKVI